MQLKAKTQSRETSCKQLHPGSHTYVGPVSANPYYIMWHKLYKINNNLYV